MEQLIYTSILIILIIVWMIINKKNMNKHILDMLEKASFDEELKSNVSVRNFYYYCEKHKIKCELKGEDLFVKYKSKDIICTQDGDFRMGRAIIHMKKAK